MQPLPLPEKLQAFGYRLRLRYVPVAMASVFALGLAINTISESSLFSDSSLSEIETSAGPAVHESLIDDAWETYKTEVHTVALAETAGTQAQIAVPFIKVVLPDTKPTERVFTTKIESGEALTSFLNRQGISKAEAYKIVSEFEKLYDPRRVKTGEKFTIHLTQGEEGTTDLLSLEYSPTMIEQLTIVRNAEGSFMSSLEKKELRTIEKAAKVQVQSSLYGSAAQVGLPDHVIMDLIHIYSWKVDFQRDVRSGDTIEVLYEEEATEDGHSTNKFRILYANMKLSGQDMPIYRYEDTAGDADFFTKDGKSIRQGLLKTPIAFGRVSSGFGMRKHPILGYSKMHKGVDFAAPRGTKIFAAADGVVEKKYYSSSYGNYILVRHAGGIKTAYAHMKGFASGVSQGTRVKQGQTIGFVGTTGRSTGPHLHYEVLKGGKQLNPKSVDLPTQNELSGKEKKRFNGLIASVERKFEDQVGDSDFMLASRDEE